MGRSQRAKRTRGTPAGMVTREARRAAALEGLASAAVEQVEARERLTFFARSARREGATWVQIAEVLGVTPQAVQKRFAAGGGRR